MRRTRIHAGLRTVTALKFRIALAWALMLVPVPSMATEQWVSDAKLIAKSLGSEECSLLHQKRDQNDDPFKPELYTFEHQSQYQDQPSLYRLVRVPCWLGAYNQGDAYVLFERNGAGRLVSFAVPQYNVERETDDFESPVKNISITGYSARNTVVMSDFDPKTLTISEFNKSRGLGDAFTTGEWRFDGYGFTLKAYAVDASYDGESSATPIVNFQDSR